MKRLAALAGITGLAALAGLGAIALLLSFRGDAAAAIRLENGSSGGCIAISDLVPAFCLNVPTSTVRRDTAIPLATVPAARADVRVEVGVPGVEAAAIAAGVDRSVEHVESVFGRRFETRPRVLVFATQGSFATGASDLFSYSPATSRAVAESYGGIFDRATGTVAVNWSASGTSRLQSAIAHELAHSMIREMAGDAAVPAWLDEGIATIVQQDTGLSSNDEERLTGRAVAASGAISLSQLTTVADFHRAYARVGRPLYAYAADVVRTLDGRVGWDGILRIIASLAKGADFDRAYATMSGETIASLERAIARPASAAIAVSPMIDGKGNRGYSLYTPQPGPVAVTITGVDGYSVSFVVTTDAFGIYRGTFGSTARPGAYTVGVAGTTATLLTIR